MKGHKIYLNTIPFNGMISELFESNDDFDYIIAMDQSNVDDIKVLIQILKENYLNC